MFIGISLRIAIIAMVVVAGPAQAGDTPWKRVWSDDFTSSSGLDPDHWTIVRGDGCPALCGFGNQERQTYRANRRNLRIEDGILIIEAHRGRTYSSAKITSEKLPGWTHGRVEVRAKLPRGIGTWPAIWMLPDDQAHGAWPKSGEIDIMEHVGFEEGHIHGTIHSQAYNHRLGTQKGGEMVVDDATSAFHVYAIEWTATAIRWLVDDREYFAVAKAVDDGPVEWPFDRPFHLILNLAVGGEWGGAKGVDRNAFPARFEIDWVRVSQ